MSVRITCPACETSMSVNDSKRGTKVRCKECDKSIVVPDEMDAAIQDSRKMAPKAVPLTKRKKADYDDEDDDDDRPAKSKKAAKKGFPVMLLVGGGVAALFLVGLVAAASVVAILLYRSSPAEAKQAQAPARIDKVGIEMPIPQVENPQPMPIPVPGPNIDPNPNADPNPKNDPRPNPKVEPGPKPAPKPIVDPNPGKPLPDQLDPNLVPAVKQATVYLRVTLPNGQMAEGSGFFAVEPGIVITNAHVLGMLQATSQPPKQVELTINSGEPNAKKLVGQVLGVDRASDLAVVRVADSKDLPTPLVLETNRPLIETQKVYIAGFPFGAQLGANITISPSAVSSLRKNAAGNLEQIQVNGGMSPGNSGGPVVNSVGHVVGVAVAVIKGTQINFAVPADNVRLVLEGRLADSKMGEAFLQTGQAHLPMKYTCLDPLNRVSGMQVEVWTGMPGQVRPESIAKPQALPGDGQRQIHTIAYKSGAGELNVPLPPLPPGQVYWVQPVITTAKGAQWGTALPTPTAVLPLERKPANLMVNFTAEKERTVKVKSYNSSTLIIGKKKDVLTAKVEANLLETVGPDAKGTLVRTAIGSAKVDVDIEGKPLKLHPQVVNELRQIPPVFLLDSTNRMLSRTDRKINPLMNVQLKSDLSKAYNQLCNSLECTIMPMPNRTLQPMETWQTQIPLILRPNPNLQVVDLALTCTYEGTRTRNQRSEGFISIVGRVQGRGISAKNVGGEVVGKVALDLTGGFIGQANFKITSEDDLGGLEIIDVIETELTRTPGNPLGIPAAPEFKDPGPIVLGKTIFSLGSALLPTDLPVNDPKLAQANARMKVHPVPLQAGKNYVISLNSNAFDSYLILESPTGQRLAEDDDGGGYPNARIIHGATQTGVHRIIVTAFDGKTGPYQLTVQEIGVGKGGDPVPPKKVDPFPPKKIDPFPPKKVDPLPPKGGDPAPKKAIEFVPKVFMKPAAAQNPTSYVKVVSPPGDFIGQGKSFDYPGAQVIVKKTPRGLKVTVDGWALDVAVPNGQVLEPGEYLNAKRYPLNGNSPGLNFSGKGRGANKLSGEFVVWELEMNGNQVVRLAIDFIQRAEEKGPPLQGKVRINSSLQ